MQQTGFCLLAPPSDCTKVAFPDAAITAAPAATCGFWRRGTQIKALRRCA